MPRALAILLLGVTLAAQAPDDTKRNFISLKLIGAVDEAGMLRATFSLLATGAASKPYRDAYSGVSAEKPQNLFGPFVQTRKGLSAATAKVPQDPAQPIEISFPVTEDELILPVVRQAAVQFNLLPTPLTGQPGSWREEIRFEIPPDFDIRVAEHKDEDRPFARYRSDATVQGNKLTVVRELQWKSGAPASSDQAETKSFWTSVVADEARSFVFRRIARADPSAWIASVPSSRAVRFGVRAYDQREFDAARQLFEKATLANANDPYAWNNLGRALAALGKLSEAQAAYERQIAINASDLYAYNNLAVVFERQGNWAQAIDNLRRQLQVRPGDRSATVNLPRALAHLHRWVELEAAAQSALALQPENALQQLNVSIARVCAGKITDVRAEMDRALGPHPTSAALNNAAYYLSECDQPNELTEAYVRRALEQERKTSDSLQDAPLSRLLASQNSISTYLDTYGWILFKEGKLDKAVETLAASVALTPRAEVYAHLAQAEEQAGHGDKASRYWQQAAFLEPGRTGQIPKEFAADASKFEPLSVDREWYPLEAVVTGEAAASLAPDRPLYFFAWSDANGAVRGARALDADDFLAKTMLPAVNALAFVKVTADGSGLPTVHILRILKGQDGKIGVARSVGSEALAIAADLAPKEFPLPAPGGGQSPGSRAPFRIGGGVTAPTVTYKVEPQYSEEARHAFVQGTVVLQVVVGTDGVAHDVKVLRSLGSGLDEEAIISVQAWRFKPGDKAGEPVNVLATIEVNFRLVKNKDALVPWHVGKILFSPPGGAVRPKVVKAFTPRLSGSPNVAAVTVAFEVDEQGNPVNIRVQKTDEETWAADVLAAFSKWRFSPGQRDGLPITVPGTIEFVRAQ